MTTHYYNEIDPYCAAWLQNLMDAGHIAQGVIDTRSIEDVRPDELAGYVQCHFFAGLGGWSYALDLAGWPRDRPVWTGSCPCQPFSAAGKGAGFADQRHLWPSWQHLIAQCRPAIVFGEQVASKDADAWVDLVHADLEGMGYAFGCIPFPAAGIGAAHIRDRNYWMADTSSSGLESGCGHAASAASGRNADAGGCSFDGMGHTNHCRYRSQDAAVDHGKSKTNRPTNISGRSGASPSQLAHPNLDRRPSRRLPVRPREQVETEAIESRYGSHGGTGPLHGFWADADWLGCSDGRWRPVEPGTFPLAHGIPNRVGRLRAYGNAIVPQVAKAFIESYCEARGMNIQEQAA